MNRISTTLCAVAVLAAITAGCSGMQGGNAGPTLTTKDCTMLQFVANSAEPLLAGKCAKAPDPATDASCLAIVGMRTAVGACFLAAQDDNADAVAKAMADFKDAQGQAPVALPPVPDDPAPVPPAP